MRTKMISSSVGRFLCGAASESLPSLCFFLFSLLLCVLLLLLYGFALFAIEFEGIFIDGFFFFPEEGDVKDYHTRVCVDSKKAKKRGGLKPRGTTSERRQCNHLNDNPACRPRLFTPQKRVELEDKEMIFK